MKWSDGFQTLREWSDALAREEFSAPLASANVIDNQLT